MRSATRRGRRGRRGRRDIVGGIDVRHRHLSGRYDSSEEAVYADLKAATTSGRWDLISLTEVAAPPHQGALRRAAADFGWELFQVPGPGVAECAFLLDPKVGATKVYFESLPVTEQTFYTGTGKHKVPIHVPTLVLEFEGVRAMFAAAHMPSHVEVAGVPHPAGPTNRVRAYYSVLLGWRRQANRLRRRYRIAARNTVLVADWNLDFSKRWVSRFLADTWPQLYSTWRRFSGPGTHGRRFIDSTLTRARVVVPAHVLAEDDSASDHTAYGEVLRVFTRTMRRGWSHRQQPLDDQGPGLR